MTSYITILDLLVRFWYAIETLFFKLVMPFEQAANYFLMVTCTKVRFAMNFMHYRRRWLLSAYGC